MKKKIINFITSLRGRSNDQREFDPTKQSLCEHAEIASSNKAPFGRFVLLAMTSLTIFASCTSVNEPPFSPQIVIQGYLYANEPLDSIVIRKTIPITGRSADDRISNAIVTLSTGDSVYMLHNDSSFLPGGRYVSDHPIVIQPGATYTLRVEALAQVATASTTVPLPIHLDSVKLDGQVLSLTEVDTIAYPKFVDSLASPGIHLWWSPSPGSAGYGIEAISLDTSADTILDAVSSAVGDSGAMGRYHFFILSTNEQVVWPQFTRYGLNAVRALALDKNYEDYVLGFYLSGSQFNNSTLDVQGGLGIFASAARASKLVYLK